MDQLIVAAFAVVAFGGVVVGYAIAARENRAILLTPQDFDCHRFEIGDRFTPPPETFEDRARGAGL